MSDTPRLSDEALGQAAECLRILAHPHRLRMIELLLAGDHPVGDLAEVCGIASHQASEHLRLMKHCGFLDSRREGRQVFYYVIEPHLAQILGCIRGRFGSSVPPDADS